MTLQEELWLLDTIVVGDYRISNPVECKEKSLFTNEHDFKTDINYLKKEKTIVTRAQCNNMDGWNGSSPREYCNSQNEILTYWISG